jgi:ABC-type Mn2+/Zn2+ transport system permease subunit
MTPVASAPALIEGLSAAFLQRALIEAVLVGAICGVVGVHVLLRRLPFFAMAMGHATFPGVVLASLLGVDLLLGAGAFGLAVVLAVGLLGAVRRVEETSAIGIVLSGSFAFGVLLIGTQAGFSRDLTAFLVGSIVTVQQGDLVLTAVAGCLVLLALALLHKELVLGAFDRGALVALGYPALALDLGFLVILEITVVTAVPAVGTVLSVALIAAPAATARLWTDRIGPSMVVAGIVGAASGVAGLAISTAWRVAAGPTIALVTAGCFAASLLAAPRHGLLARALRARRRRRAASLAAAPG